MSQWKWTFTWIPRAGWIRLWPASMTRLAISLKLPLRISKFDLEWGDDLAMLRNHKHNFQLDFLFCVFFFFFQNEMNTEKLRRKMNRSAMFVGNWRVFLLFLFRVC